MVIFLQNWPEFVDSAKRIKQMYVAVLSNVWRNPR